MSSINDKIIEEFSTWAGQNENKKIFPQISKDKESYYIDRVSEETYMMEYSFNTMPELRSALETYSGLADDSQMLRMLTINIYQNNFLNNNEEHKKKNIDEIREEENKVKGQYDIPDYIYVF